MRLSYSALDTYQTCPLKYKYREIDHIREPKSKEAVFGTLIHSVMHHIHSPTLVHPTVEGALDFFAKNWNADVWKDEFEERAAFSQGVSMIQGYYARNDPAAANIVDLESRFSISIGDEANGGHTVAGIIDRIDRTDAGYEIIDYKTAKKMPSQEAVDANLQLTIYLRAFLDRYPKERENLANITVALYFLKHGVKLSSVRTEEDFEKLERTFLDVIAAIEAGRFDPVLSPLCDWCGYQRICPLWRHKFAEERRMDSGEARSAIDEYIAVRNEASAVKRRIAELQERILGYMEVEGVDRVFGSSGIIGKSVRRSYRYDEERLREVLGPLGVLDSAFKVDPIALKKLSQSLPKAAREEIEAAREVDRESVSLTVKRGSGDESDSTAVE